MKSLFHDLLIWRVPASPGKRFFAAACVVGLLLWLVFPAAAQAQDYAYTTNDDTITITGYYGPDSEVTIPGMLSDLPVTRLGDNAFVWCTSLTGVTIPVGVTNIGDYAFKDCRGLVRVTIPNSVTRIGSGAFSGCSSLAGAAIPNSVASLGDGMFQNCTKLASVTLPANITSLGTSMFQQCTNLVNITIPGSVTSLGSSAFQDCNQLTGVYFQGNAPGADGTVFMFANKVVIYYLPWTTGWGPTFSGRTTVPWNPSYRLAVNGGIGGGSYTNQQRVTIMAGEPSSGMAFSRWTGATQYVANTTSSTTMVTMPHQNISVTATYRSTGEYTYTTSSGKIIITRYTGAGGEVVIPGAIDGLPVTSIGNNAFQFCTSLAGVTIPDSVTSIGNNAFEECTGLALVTIGTNIASIGNEVFYNSSSLTGVYFKGNPPGLGSSVFTGAGNAVIYYLPGAKNWGATFGGRRTVLWNPRVSGTGFGVQTNQFGFTIAATNSFIVVVEACTSLADPDWSPMQTNLLAGSSYFTDSQWTNHSGRFYHLRMP